MAVYSCRYLDVFYGITHFAKVPNLVRYNTIMKVLFLGSQATVIYHMLVKYRATYHSALDSFRAEFLVGPCLLLALFFRDSPAGFFPLIREVLKHRSCSL